MGRVDEVCWIPERLPGLNDIISWRGSRYKGTYSREKRKGSALLVPLFQSTFKPWDAAHVTFELVEPNSRRDPDNAVCGAAKWCLDSLVEAGILANDGWRQILSLSFAWRVDKDNPGVLLTLSEEK